MLMQKKNMQSVMLKVKCHYNNINSILKQKENERKRGKEKKGKYK